MDLKTLAERYFSLYPEKDVLYATPDGNFFLDKSGAANHARASASNYFSFERNKVSKESNPDNSQDEKKAELKERALKINPETGDYREMLTILHGLNLVPESKKKVDVIVAFKNYLASVPAADAGEAKSETGETETGETKTETTSTPTE